MSRPNIVLIFTDQQRFDTLHAAGNPVIKTPNIDRLTGEGVRFESAYTPSPVCVSARCSLIFGQYPHNTGCYDNGFAFPDDRPSFIQSLTDAGYRTHGIGKMHFAPDALAKRGFQSREIQEELRSRIDDSDYIQFLHSNGYEHVYDPFGQRGEMYYIPQVAQMAAKYHGTNWVGDRSVNFVEKVSGDDPFFLFSSFIHPHPPFSPPTPWNKLYRAPLMPLPKMPADHETLLTHTMRHQNRYKYRDQGIDNNLIRMIKAYYYACISFIDFQVGKIVEALEKKGVLDNTLIIFTSDHGELLGDYNCFGKRSMLDSAARVPMLISFPDQVAAGEVCHTPTSLVDVCPTFVTAAGVADRHNSSDGVDLVKVAGGEYEGRTVYSQFQHEDMGVYMACSNQWKYFYSAPDRREFLFDRTSDPLELRDLSGVSLRSEKQKAMKDGLISYYRNQGYTEHLEGNDWKVFEQPELPINPDSGLLIQDAPWAKPFQEIPGYTDTES